MITIGPIAVCLSRLVSIKLLLGRKANLIHLIWPCPWHRFSPVSSTFHGKSWTGLALILTNKNLNLYLSSAWMAKFSLLMDIAELLRLIRLASLIFPSIMIGTSLTGTFIDTVFRLVKKEASSRYLIYRTAFCPRKTIRSIGLIGVREKLENLIKADIAKLLCYNR